jgi:hypothetical protein
MTGERIQEVL